MPEIATPNVQTSLSPPVIAHHEAGHAVAGIVLGVPFIEVRIVPSEDGKIGVPLKTNPWVAPRPPFNPPGEFTDEEWAELSQDDAKWEAWQKKDNDNYAVFMLAGKAAQIEYAGTARDEDAKFDYSFIQHVLPDCYARLAELEAEATQLVKGYWLAVLAVAAELLNRSKLTADEVREIFERTMPGVQLPKSKG